MSRNIGLLVVVGLAIIVMVGLVGLVGRNNQDNATEILDPSGPVVEQPTPMEPKPTSVSTAGADVTVGKFVLTIASPLNNAVVTSANLAVKGNTVAGAEVVVNDKETKADAKGNFLVTLVLDEGANDITVVANDSDGNYSEQSLMVTYMPNEN